MASKGNKGVEYVYCAQYGGFGLSPEAQEWMIDHGFTAKGDKYWAFRDMNRADPLLVQCVRELGSERASGGTAKLKITRVPKEAHEAGAVYVSEYDGFETIEVDDGRLAIWRISKLLEQIPESERSEVIGAVEAIANDVLLGDPETPGCER